MKEFSYVVTEAEGLHARPTNLLVKKAAGYRCAVRISAGGRTADLKRIFAVMALGAQQGDTILVQCAGEDEEQAARALEMLAQKYL